MTAYLVLWRGATTCLPLRLCGRRIDAELIADAVKPELSREQFELLCLADGPRPLRPEGVQIVELVGGYPLGCWWRRQFQFQPSAARSPGELAGPSGCVVRLRHKTGAWAVRACALGLAAAQRYVEGRGLALTAREQRLHWSARDGASAATFLGWDFWRFEAGRLAGLEVPATAGVKTSTTT